jgi:hypothetical protein
MHGETMKRTCVFWSNLSTPWSRVLVEKLTLSYSRNSRHFMEHAGSLLSILSTLFKSTLSHTVSLTFILMSSPLRLDLLYGLFFQVSPPNLLCCFISLVILRNYYYYFTTTVFPLLSNNFHNFSLFLSYLQHRHCLAYVIFPLTSNCK